MTLDLSAFTSGAIVSPFSALRSLLNDIPAGHERPIELTIGEPRGAMPPFVADAIAAAAPAFGQYPPIRGSDALRGAIRDWLARRYAGLGLIDAEREILPLSGSREGLFYIAVPAVSRRFAELAARGQRPAIQMCNPYYSSYLAGALAVGAEPVFLDCGRAQGFLPDLDALADDTRTLARTVAVFIASPSNPQGAVASPAYIARALDLARAHDFVLVLDECYSEIYSDEPPTGGLQVAAATPERFANLIVFNSLSKRSNLPGLRSGFCAGDAGLIQTFADVRNLCAPTVPGPIQSVSAAVWSDETHVEAARARYRANFACADACLSGHFDYARPAGGFCLWLDVHQFGGGRDAAVTLWKRAGVKVIPGSFLAQAGRDGKNPGDDFIRLALVQDTAAIQEALERTVCVLR